MTEEIKKEETTEKKGIEETKDMLNYADAILDELYKAKQADGSLSTTDIIAAVANTAAKGVDAAWGAWEIPKEIKDLDEEEKKQLLDMCFPIIVKFVMFFKPSEG